MPNRTVIVPVQFAVAVSCEYTNEGILIGTESSFHPVNISQDSGANKSEGDAWEACLEVPPLMKDGSECESWPDYQETARQRLSMELGRPIFWDGEDSQDDD